MSDSFSVSNSFLDQVQTVKHLKLRLCRSCDSQQSKLGGGGEPREVRAGQRDSRGHRGCLNVCLNHSTLLVHEDIQDTVVKSPWPLGSSSTDRERKIATVRTK